MEETKYFLIAICVAISLIGGCTVTVNHQDNKAMADMIAHGVSAIDARCAVKTINESESFCAIRATK